MALYTKFGRSSGADLAVAHESADIRLPSLVQREEALARKRGDQPRGWKEIWHDAVVGAEFELRVAEHYEQLTGEPVIEHVRGKLLDRTPKRDDGLVDIEVHVLGIPMDPKCTHSWIKRPEDVEDVWSLAVRGRIILANAYVQGVRLPDGTFVCPGFKYGRDIGYPRPTWSRLDPLDKLDRDVQAALKNLKKSR